MPKTSPRTEMVFSAVPKDEWHPTTKVVAAVGGRREAVSNILRQLYDSGRVQRRGLGRRYSPFEWCRAPLRRLKITSKVTCFVEASEMYQAAEAVDEALRGSARVLDFGAEHSIAEAKDSEWPEAMPKRIQLRRTKGWRKPAGTVVVSRPSKWGNPYVIETRDDYEGRFIVRDARTGDVLCVCGTKEEARRDATFLFRDELATQENLLRFTVEDVSRELRDKDLACWCPLDQPCHADVLLEVANG